MGTQSTLRLVLSVALAIIPSIASAQSVVVTFDGGAAAVPLSFWLTPAIAIALVAVGYKSIRARLKDASTRVLWGILLVSGLTASAVLPWVPDVRAAAMDLLTLRQSPARFVIPQLAIFGMIQSGGGYGFAVENQTAQPVTIRGRNFEDNPNEWLYFYLPAPPLPEPECIAGLLLAPNERCYIWMASRVHW